MKTKTNLLEILSFEEMETLRGGFNDSQRQTTQDTPEDNFPPPPPPEE